MLNPTYLTMSRHNVFYFRWPLPKNLRQKGKTTHFKLSLRTREPKQALRLANALEYHISTLFQQGYGAGMNFNEMKEHLETYFQEMLKHDKAEIDQNGPLSPEKTEKYQKLSACICSISAANFCLISHRAALWPTRRISSSILRSALLSPDRPCIFSACFCAARQS